MTHQDLEGIVNRYDRQERISGWNQEKLEKAKVVVVGNDIMANYCAITLAAFGFGSIELYGPGFVTKDTLSNFKKNNAQHDYSDGFLYFDSHEGDSKSAAVAEFVKIMNPAIDAYGVNLDLCRTRSLEIMGKPDIIIETTNDPASKFMIIEYASQKRIPVISMSASEYKAKLGVYNPHSRRRDKKKLIENIVFAEFTGKRQGPTVSQVIAGLGIEEARKYIMPLRNEKIIDDIVAYNLLSNKRFECTDDKELTALDNFSEKTCLMVGAGALGNFAGLDLVLNNIGTLMIADFDTVESTNLNRQIWFYDSVGRLKAEALVEKLKKVNPNVKFDYSRSKVTPESEFFFKENKIDLMIDTVDNNSTRALLNYFAVKYQIPFISGGTRYNSGQVTVYKPGESACLNCQADIDQLALASYHPASCIYAAEPSVITSNQIIGGIIGGESKVILNPEKYGRVIPFVLKYVSNEAFRLGALPSPAATCECHADKKKTKKWLKKMKHLYEVKK